MSEPKEVKDMMQQLSEVRRVVRGVKESARSLRALPKSERFKRLTDAPMKLYDSEHPPAPTSDDDTVRRSI